MQVVGYAYDADHHCIDCTRKYVESTVPDLEEVDKVMQGEREHEDSEGNPIHAMFDTEETDYPVHCSDCGRYIDTSWTDEAVEMVHESLRDYLVTGHGNTDALDIWADELSNAVPSQEIEIVLSIYEDKRKEEKANAGRDNRMHY